VFYEPDKNNHGLPFNPLTAYVVPRPIGWISTVNSAGRINLAPFSQFNIVGLDPAYVMFSAGGHLPRRASFGLPELRNHQYNLSVVTIKQSSWQDENPR
jgi:flavin reductase (DIM6/NTAB) family NADH-FMN oxidoreductase RutF